MLWHPLSFGVLAGGTVVALWGALHRDREMTVLGASMLLPYAAMGAWHWVLEREGQRG